MTDETTTETTEVAEAVEETPEVDGPKQLREALKRTNAENAELRAQLMESAYKEAKLDPSTGLGKAIAKEYKGDPTAESLLAFAEDEYDYVPVPTPDNIQAVDIVEGTERVDAMQAISTSTVPLTEADELQKAQAEGDLTKSGAIKAGQLRRLMKP